MLPENTAPRPSRRTLIRGTLGFAALATAGPLAACGSDDTPATSETPAQSPGSGGASGGRLRLGAAGAATPTLNVLTATGMVDYIAMFSLYDSLAVLRGDQIELQLAESFEANADATEFTVGIRSDATFHDGRPCTAHDVRYSLATLADPDQSPNFSQFYSDLDVANLDVIDEHTLRIALHRPRADFVTTSLATFSMIFPADTAGEQWEEGIGSGPLRLASSSGGSYVLERNPDYWGEPAFLDEVELIAINDAETRLNALRGGEIDYAHSISPAGAAVIERDDSLAVVRGGPANSQTFALEMNVNQAPFDDPGVRLAMKLLVDREALVETVLFGQGVVGNDLMGQGLVGFNTDIPQRERDLDEARSLLETAGVSEVTLRVAELAPGMTDAATLFAEQAAEAGLTITLETADADTFFADYETLMSTPFQSVLWINRPAATFTSIFTGSAGSFNVTGMGGPEYDALLDELHSSLDEETRQVHLDEIQRELWDRGGNLLWGFAEQLDATVPGVEGITYVQSLPRLGQLRMT
ncbi:ABC transporter substrate-binding protein [Phytoactinopolyspora mesophila]|nr:ABC transporter substrate-binding protein [Phytoactinopolyspora mesophila]